MTKPRNSVLKPWMVALSLGATVGGWVFLARQATDSTQQVTPAPSGAMQSATVELPPIPTVQALQAYAAPASASGSQVDLPPVPQVAAPALRPQTQAPSASAPLPARPFVTTRSSR